LDAGHVLFSNVSGYKVGLQYERSPVSPYDNAGEQTIMGNVFTNCTEALRVESVKSLKILQCGFYGITYGIRHITDGDLLLTDCTISGGAEAVHDDPTTSVHSFNFQGCTFNGSINVTNKGTLSAVSCNFVRNGVDILLNPGVSRAIISGCTFADGPNITNNSGAAAGDIQISHTPVASQVSPPLPTTYDKVRKPDKVTLFNVLNFGATGDGTTDDTVAVQSALQGAQTNGGGIVFFPAGKYRMTNNLNVGAGIELRGVHGGRHTPDSTTLGSVITINHGKSSDTGTAFITLGDRSGIRGLTFHYPDQSYLTPYKYPFMIRCQGFRIYLIDDAATDAYQAVDLDNADQHLVEYSFFGAWKKAYQIGGGSENGRIQNLHVKWDFWRDSALDGYPSNITEHDRGEVTCGKNLNTFTLNNCSNQTLFAIFNHACHTFITQNGGSGAAYGVAAEELQRGVVLNTNAASGRFDFVVCALNVHNQGDWAGKCAFMVNSNFTGDVVFYNTFFRGNPEYLISSDSGNLVLQQGDFNSGGSRGVAVIKAGGNVTMDNCGYGIPFDLDVPAEGSMKSRHTHFDGGYGNMGVVGVVSNILNTYAGSVIMADINQAPPRARGITINTSNVAPVLVNTFPAPSGSRSTMDYVSQFYGYHRVSGSNILFNITDPDFTNAAAGSVDIKIQYLEDTDGTVKVYYDSTSGEKLGATWAISATNGAWANKTIQVNDARFNSPTNDIRIEIIGTTADPVFAHVSVESDSFLGLPGSNNPPGITALFTGMPTTGARPLAVTFTDQSTGSITNLLWAFGDGQTTNTAGGAIIAHTYTTAGSYPVTLIASGIGGSSTSTKFGYVTVNLPPSPRIDGISVAGMTNILLTGTGGPTNGLHYYWVRSATNLTVPLMNWSVLSTNPFHADGSFSSLLPASPVTPQRFYRLQLP
jgi:PKD repeat protein